MLNVCAYFFIARDILEFFFFFPATPPLHHPQPLSPIREGGGDMKESKAHNAGGIKGFLGGPENQGPSK